MRQRSRQPYAQPQSHRPQPVVATAFGALALALLASATHSSATAAADELLRLGYTCALDDGRIVMSASADRDYRIIGSRELQSLKVCNGQRGTDCIRLEIHRLVFDCDGFHVAWHEAAAVLPGQSWRATLARGRLTLRLSEDGERGRRPPLTLPSGFGPAPSTGLRFVPAPSPAMTAERPAAAPLHRVATGPGATTGDTGSPRQAGADRATGSATQPMGQGWSATIMSGEEPGGERRNGLLPLGGASGPWLAALALAALLISATVVAGRQRLLAGALSGGWTGALAGIRSGAQLAATLLRSGMARLLSTPGTEASAAKAGTGTPIPPPPRPTRTRIESDATANAPPTAKPAGPALPETNPDWADVIELRTTSAALIEIVGQMIADHVPDGALRAVLTADLAAISQRLDGPELHRAIAEGRLDQVHPIYAQAVIDLERVRTLARIEHERTLTASTPRQTAPETVDEACRFLGINPRASEAVVKKVVDALRQNWHPDLASDDADRAEREAHIKRINAAWDLIRTR